MNITAQIYTETLNLTIFSSILRLKLPQSNVFKQEDYEAQRFPNNTVNVNLMLTFYSLLHYFLHYLKFCSDNILTYKGGALVN